MAICRKPWITHSRDIAPCGQCPECLINRKQLWTNRNILESYAHVKKSFITLTYSDENMPLNSQGIPTLNKKHLQQFLKNLRTRLPDKLRYYAVGEYGTAGERGINPHYHLLMYGVDQERCYEIQDAWRTNIGRGKTGDYQGFSHVDDLNDQTIAYVAGYVEKKTKYNKDMYEDLEIEPEFSTMSLKPTIGANAIPKLVTLFKNNPDYLTNYGDVPYSILHGSRSLPLGNYIREKVREGLNLPHDTKTFVDDLTGEITEKKIWHGKEEKKLQLQTEMQILQQNQEIYDPKLPQDAQISVKQFYQYKNKQNQLSFDARQKLKHNSRSL